MSVFDRMTWCQYLFVFTVWIFTDMPSCVRHSSRQNYDKARDHVNLLKDKKPLGFLSRPKFPRFKELPPEIRAQIWRASFEPRIIELRSDYGPRTMRLDDDWNAEYVHAITVIPAQLHTCLESRIEALKVYTLSFGSCAADSVVYFSPVHDTVFFGGRWGFYGPQHYKILTQARTRRTRGSAAMDLSQQERRMVGWDKIQSIALKLRSYNFANVGLLASDLAVLPDLKEVTLVNQDGAKVFDLGRKPRLVRWREGNIPEEAAAVMERKVNQLRAWLDRLWIERGLNLGDVPSVSAGAFVKGASDRWYVWKRGTWQF